MSINTHQDFLGAFESLLINKVGKDYFFANAA